ncbi:spermidine synthase [Actinomadura vinacea]|uniref:Polyamine aminopropyltransferase n=1 Tax=Actinomadura vinacea TaxID=115336 RepID=A0ABP5XEA5_9ACTN
MIGSENSGYIEEPLGDGLKRVWRLDEVLWAGDTAFQHVVIAKTAQGVTLFCGNDRQSSEFSQLVYHEALLVPALLLADRVESVLVIGSSEGVVSQMARTAGAARIDHVDIDREAVELCARLLPYGYTPEELDRAERHDGPVRMHYADGWEFVASKAGAAAYDIVLVDLPDEGDDENEQHNRLYGVEFLRMCRSVLAPGGVAVSQAGCATLWRNTTLVRSWKRFAETFPTVAYFGSDEHEWSFLFGRADEIADPLAVMTGRLERCAYRPVSIDAAALTGCSVPPYSVRHAGR